MTSSPQSPSATPVRPLALVGSGSRDDSSLATTTPSALPAVASGSDCSVFEDVLLLQPLSNFYAISLQRFNVKFLEDDNQVAAFIGYLQGQTQTSKLETIIVDDIAQQFNEQAQNNLYKVLDFVVGLGVQNFIWQHNQISPVILSEILQRVAVYPELAEIEIKGSVINGTCIELIGKALTAREIRKLQLDHCYFDDAMAQVLAPGLARNVSLQQLSIYNHVMQDNGLIALAKAIADSDSCLVTAELTPLSDGFSGTKVSARASVSLLQRVDDGAGSDAEVRAILQEPSHSDGRNITDETVDAWRLAAEARRSLTKVNFSEFAGVRTAVSRLALANLLRQLEANMEGLQARAMSL